jgi:NTE family protein
MTRALVLAGGGVTGIAWETGMLLGLRDEGVDLTGADLVLGTSAGSAVGAQVCTGADLEELFERQLSDEHLELAPDLDLDLLIALYTELGDISRGLDEADRRKVGAFAKQAKTVDVDRRRDVIAARLPSHDRPERDLRVTAVDADTGELLVLDKSSGAGLVDAVAASCSVPGVWPPVPLLGRVLIDGGTRSIANLDLATGYDEVVALLPMSVAPLARSVEREADQLRRDGSRVTVLIADEGATAAMGPNPLDTATRRPTAEAGRRQGRGAAGRL